MADEIVLYVGTHKIASSDQNSETGIVSYRLEGSQRIWRCTLEQFKAIADTEPYPDADMRQRKLKAVVKEILDVLLKHNTLIEDVGYLMKTVTLSIDDSYDKAVAKMFGRQHPDHIELSQIDEVLKTDMTGEQK